MDWKTSNVIVYTNSFSIYELTITKLQEDQCYMCTIGWKILIKYCLELYFYKNCRNSFHIYVENS